MRFGLRHYKAQHRGIITALVAVAMVAVFAIAALSIDGGRLLDARRHAKAASDAAARGAAIEMLEMQAGTNPTATLSTIRSSAFQIAAANGYTNDGSDSEVTVNTPPQSGTYAGKSGYIEVIIESKLQRGFSRLMGSDPLSAVGRSVAVGTFIPTKGSVLVLNQKKKNALALGKGTSVLTVAGDIAVNSVSKSPLSIAKKGQIRADNVSVSGSLTNKQLRDLRKGIVGELHTRVPATPDPYSSLAVPSPGPDRQLNDYKTVSNGKTTYNLEPGRYNEDWKFGHDDVVKLKPGVYYIDGKKIDFKDSASVIGSGVTIYSAGKKEMRFHTTGEVSLSPPVNGTYSGISLFKDPKAKGKITFKKDADLNISGAIYAPSSLVRFQHSTAAIGDDDDSPWNDLDSDLDDAVSGEDINTSGSIGANIVADMLKVDKHSQVNIQGANLNLLRPILGLVE